MDMPITRVNHPDPLLIQEEASRLPKVEEVRLECLDGDEPFMHAYDHYLDGFGDLQKVIVVFPKPARATEGYWDTMLSRAGKYGNYTFGVPGRLKTLGLKSEQVSRWYESNLAERMWVWDSGKGQILDEVCVDHWREDVITLW